MSPLAETQHFVAARMDEILTRFKVGAKITVLVRLPFEHLVTHPAGAAETLAAFLSPHRLDTQAMISAVMPRSTGCLPGLLELELL